MDFLNDTETLLKMPMNESAANLGYLLKDITNRFDIVVDLILHHCNISDQSNINS